MAGILDLVLSLFRGRGKNLGVFENVLNAVSEEINKSNYAQAKNEATVPEAFARRYSNVTYYTEGLAGVKRDGKWGYIDKSGNEVIPPKYDSIGEMFENGINSAELNGKHGFIDNTGREIIEFKFDFVRCFCEGLCATRNGDKWGYINLNGDIVIDFVYDEAWHFANGSAKVKKDGREFRINRSGIEI